MALETIFNFKPRGMQQLPNQMQEFQLSDLTLQQPNLQGINNKDLLMGAGGAALGLAGILAGLNQSLPSGQIDPTPIINRLKRLEQQERSIAATEAIRRLASAGLAGTGLAQRVASEAEARVASRFAEILSNTLAQIEVQNQQMAAQRDFLKAQQQQDIYSGIANLGLSIVSMLLI